MTEERLKTYVQNLDTFLRGGLRTGGIYILEGESGTMKSALAYYIGYMNSMEEDKKTLYITMEQTQDSLQRQMRSMGMDDEEGEMGILPMDLATMRITTEISAEAWFKLFKTVISDFKIQEDYALLVVDSLDSLIDVSRIKQPRGDLFLIFGWLRSLNITAIMISEMAKGMGIEEAPAFDPAVLSDGTIRLLVREEEGGKMQRYLQLVKMRSDKQYRNLLKFKYDKDKFLVEK
jgi:circadian clock protein KaiC